MLNDETPARVCDLLRQTTHDGRRPDGTDTLKPRTPRGRKSKGVGPEQTRITKQKSLRNNRWTGRPHRSPGNGAPPGVGAGWVGWNWELRLPATARRRKIASTQKVNYLVRQGNRLRSGDQKRAHANRTRMLTCPPVGCSGTSAPRQAAIDARLQQTLERTKPKEASGGASAETSARRYGLDGGIKP
jgi:hypothetical protein